MDDASKLTKAVRGLAVAVWILCLLTAIQILFSLWAWFRPQTFSGVEMASTGVETPATASNDIRDIRMDNEFSSYPPEEKVRRASLIVITKYERDGDRMKAVITEILKKTPETRFYHEVGGEYHQLSHMANEHSHGDGQVAFLTGNPARMNVSYSFENDRIGGLGHLPIAKLRELASTK